MQWNSNWCFHSVISIVVMHRARNPHTSQRDAEGSWCVGTSSLQNSLILLLVKLVSKLPLTPVGTASATGVFYRQNNLDSYLTLVL